MAGSAGMAGSVFGSKGIESVISGGVTLDLSDDTRGFFVDERSAGDGLGTGRRRRRLAKFGRLLSDNIV